jgi:hypothetical protein
LWETEEIFFDKSLWPSFGEIEEIIEMGDTEFVFIEEIFEEFLLAGVADFVFLDD